MKKTSIYAALLACSLTFAGAAFQTANAAIVMRAGHDSPETVPVAKGLAKFADLVNERTKGEVQIQVFNNGIVGSASDYAVNCQLGTLDIGAVNQSVMTSFIPDIEAVDIPYLITTYEQADKLFAGDGPLTKYYTEEINNAGINLVNLDVWEVGFREFSNSTREINTADDIAGIRLRVMDSQVHQGFWKALGADPVAMSWGEAYTALQQKAIDGVENAISVLDGNNINEVNNYLTSKGMKLTHPDKASIETKVADFLKEQKARYPEIMKIIDSVK